MLGKFALQKNLISQADYDKAVLACRSSANYDKAMKQYFLENKLLSPEKINQLSQSVVNIRILQTNIRFGSTAVQMGLLDDAALSPFLQEQKDRAAANQAPEFIGRSLLESGILTKEKVLAVNRELKKKKVSQAFSPGEPESPAGDEAGGSPGQSIETLPCGIILEVLETDDNAYIACLRKTDDFDTNLEVDDIYDALSEKSIQYGLVREDLIIEFIRSQDFFEKSFEVARGTPMIQGKNARIEYYFDTDYLKAGGMDEKGNIDFRERGEIPKIEKGTLLAEKFPPEPSKNGCNIFGQLLEAEPVRDTALKTQSGAFLSDDGLQLFAEISGYPKLEWSGNINVSHTFAVNGDVNYETGHVTYKGDIDIKGCLKSGFRVTGHDITLEEIDGGQIHATGNVTVKSAVNKATIHAKGHVRVKFAHSSQIECLGNFYIEREIVDSKVNIGGACRIESGDIINSQISAGQGVFAKNLGTEKTNPNTVKTGQDLFVANEIKRITNTEKTLADQKDILTHKNESLFLENERLMKSSHRLANEIEKTRYEGQKLFDAMKKARLDAENNRDIQQLKGQMLQNRTRFSRLEKALNECFDQIGKNEIIRQDLKTRIAGIELSLDNLALEKDYYEAWEEINKGRPVAVATGTVFSGTFFQGRHSSKEIKETRSRIKVREVNKADSDTNRTAYEIIIHE